jgi:uroporphyrin-III C-methyltransferase
MSNTVLALGSDNRAALRHLTESLSLPRLEAGWVWLAGAGPGDPGLAALHTLTAIADADVIFVDALVNRTLLVLARPDADIVDSGKRGGKPSPSQDTISRRLVLAARRGKKVLRLKGGDPFVFGRGGEEALALVRAGIPFRVVPGVTAGIGGLAYAGIPVTHRDVNQAVTFVTGSGTNGRAPDVDWDAIAKGSPTIVLYMARRHAGELAARLIAAGRDPNEPAAIVSSASLDKQMTAVTTLAKLGLAAADADTPAILVIGENVRLAEGLDWLGAITQGRVLDPDPLKRNCLSDAG